MTSHNGLGQELYTWRSDAGLLPAGALDRIIFSDSVLSAAKAFILNTRLLSDQALALTDLRPDDVLLNPATGYYDHLPLVVDFQLAE